MPEHLFLITLGPVQEFIAAARRTRDLWAGSQLLSHLSRTAADALRRIEGVRMIFPAQEDLRKHDVVNRIVAMLPEGAIPQVVAADLEAAVRAALSDSASAVFNNEDRIRWPKEADYRVRSEAQVADLIEITWAAAPLLAREAGFSSSRENLEAALTSRKQTRSFSQPSWRLPVPKSSIDGIRESVIPEERFPASADTEDTRQNKIDWLFRNFGAGQAERLSGVDLFKRHYQPDPAAGYADFPSTSHFAALPLLYRFYRAHQDDPEAKPLSAGLTTYLGALEEAYRQQGGDRRLRSLQLHPRFRSVVSLNNHDASILYSNRLEEELAGEPLNHAQEALATYLQSTLGGEPEPYYALLLADGDNMGSVIDNQPGVEEQRALSLALDSFASGVRAIVEESEHRGALVYAGGDDVLAFLPLDTALDCARALHTAYQEQMQAFRAKNPAPSTLSVGIVICHHLEPLTDALELVRSAERAAKSLPGKDGLAILLSKRGGGDRTIAGRWGGSFPERLIDLIRLHRAEAIPDGAAFELHDLVQRVGRSLPLAALKAEALRILKRKRGQRGSDDTPNASLLTLATGLPEDDASGRQWGVAELADELIVTREFARALGPISQRQKGVPA